MQEWIPLIGMFVAMIAMLFGFFKWFTDWVQLRDKDIVKQMDAINKQLSERLDVHGHEFDKVHERINSHQEDLNETREQLHEGYVKHTEIDELRKQIREDFKSAFQKMGGIDRALNQLIGVIKGKAGHD